MSDSDAPSLSQSIPPDSMPEGVSESSTETSLPHALEAEQAVIGALLVDSQRFDAVAEVIQPDDFFAAKHRLIFETMANLQERELALDPVTVSEALKPLDPDDSSGGLVYLAELAASTPGSVNVVAYGKIIAERAILRRLIRVSNELSRTGFNPAGLSADELLQLAEKRVSELAEARPKEGGFQAMEFLLKDAVGRIDTLFQSDSDLTGLSTGLQDLDERTSGWQNGEMVILAARPSMGKTALALNFVEAALFTSAKPALVFSMEMPANSLMMRMLSSVGRIDQGKIRNGKLTEEDWPKLGSALEKLKGKPLFIDDTPGLTPQEVRGRVRRVAREHGNPSLVMIDYLQLMQVAGSGEGRTQEISEISRALKALAKEFDCPVVALSQLNRGVEQRPNKRPMNSDLRESGAIEQDADVILFIYRDEYYNEDSPEKGIAELIIGKQRNGEIGTCRAAFVGKYTRFDNLAPEYISANDF